MIILAKMLSALVLSIWGILVWPLKVISGTWCWTWRRVRRDRRPNIPAYEVSFTELTAFTNAPITYPTMVVGTPCHVSSHHIPADLFEKEIPPPRKVFTAEEQKKFIDDCMARAERRLAPMGISVDDVKRGVAL